MNNIPKLEIKDGKFFLTEEFIYQFPYDDVNKEFVYVRIPIGYSTNFASIPPIGRAFISPIDPQISTAALVHDFLTAEFGEVKDYPKAVIRDNGKGFAALKYDPVNWAQADAILRSIMDENGAPTWKKQTIYLAIRLYGYFRNK